jgi:acetyltransferase-like isoleucine patch superfamily enzyme
VRPGKFQKLLYKAIPNFILRRILHRLASFKFFKETRGTQTPISFEMWYNQFVKGVGSEIHWPVHSTSTVINPKNIYCGIETSPGYSPGNYIQAIGKIVVGDYTQIAANVGIISANHDLVDNRMHIVKEVYIGKYCWIGMGAIILPGVVLGNYTVVAAGAIVTKSFPDGYCVIAGNPARVLKLLDKDLCIEHRSRFEYNGYVANEQFESFRKKYRYI